MTVAGPLDGVRILDLTSVVMGPYGTQILGDLGADVITVESIGGDIARIMGPGTHPDLSGVALNLLRNKRNIRVDIKSEAGHQILLRLAATCDVVVTNLRPAVLERAKLSYEDIRGAREDIVFCQAHGFPSDGPMANEPAYDDIIQAACGFTDLSRRMSGIPAMAPTILTDKLCGLTIVYSITAALFRRERTGMGERIEIPMNETAASFMLVEHGAAAIPQPPLGEAGYSRILVENRRPHPTKDGWLAVLPYSKKHYDKIFHKGGRADLLGDERYQTGRARIINSNFLYGEVRRVIQDFTTAEWVEFCTNHDIPASPVVSIDDLVAGLPEAVHPSAGRYKQIPPPVRFKNSPQSIRRHAPLIGEHTVEVLEELGFTTEDIALLREGGAFPPAPLDV